MIISTEKFGFNNCEIVSNSYYELTNWIKIQKLPSHGVEQLQRKNLDINPL